MSSRKDVVGFNRRSPKDCQKCKGRGQLRGAFYNNTVLWPHNRAACPCTLSGLRNLDISTIRPSERRAYDMVMEGGGELLNAISLDFVEELTITQKARLEAIARRLRCSAVQVKIRGTWVAQAIQKYGK